MTQNINWLTSRIKSDTLGGHDPPFLLDKYITKMEKT